VAYEAEWVVDGAGRLVGAIGFCVAPAREGPGYTPADLQVLQTRLTKRFSGLDFGRRRGYERIVLHYGPHETMRAEGRTATAPLGPGESAIQSRCDRRALRCERDRAGYTPREIDQTALARCTRAWSSGADDLGVTLDVSPAGRVDKFQLFSTSVGRRRKPSDKRPTVPASLSSCVQKVFRRVRFPDSPGGTCAGISSSLSAFL
jgi:hypothetical protein